MVLYEGEFKYGKMHGKGSLKMFHNWGEKNIMTGEF